MVAWIAWQRDLQAWQGSVEGRLDKLEGVTGHILERIGPPRITPEHQQFVRYYVAHLSKATGKAHQTIFAALYTAFRVPRYQEIPESEWSKVEQFFRKQMPNRQLPPTTQQFSFLDDGIEDFS